MQEQSDLSPMWSMDRCPIELEARVRDARRMYLRTLASWAGDLLELRRTNARLPAWRDEPVPPSHQRRAA